MAAAGLETPRLLEVGGVMWCPVHHGIADETSDTPEAQCDMAEDGDVCNLVILYYREDGQ